MNIEIVQLIARIDKLISLLERTTPRPHKFKVGDVVTLKVENPFGVPIRGGAKVKIMRLEGFWDYAPGYKIKPVNWKEDYTDPLYSEGSTELVSLWGINEDYLDGTI